MFYLIVKNLLSIKLLFLIISKCRSNVDEQRQDEAGPGLEADGATPGLGLSLGLSLGLGLWLRELREVRAHIGAGRLNFSLFKFWKLWCVLVLVSW